MPETHSNRRCTLQLCLEGLLDTFMHRPLTVQEDGHAPSYQVLTPGVIRQHGENSYLSDQRCASLAVSLQICHISRLQDSISKAGCTTALMESERITG